jgi:DNA-directed RNA polymerase subunit M/transcription elongation factor TFIIS
MLEFCPVCKKILELGEWKGKKVGKCPCGFIRTLGFSLENEEKMDNAQLGSGVLQNNLSEGFNFSCKKCGHNKAEAKELGEILGNEKSVTLFTCMNCGSAERI